MIKLHKIQLKISEIVDELVKYKKELNISIDICQ